MSAKEIIFRIIDDLYKLEMTATDVAGDKYVSMTLRINEA